MQRQLADSLARLGVVVGAVAFLGCTGGQTDDGGQSVGTSCFDLSPRVEYVPSSELASEIAALEGDYDEALFWVDDAVWSAAEAATPPGLYPFVDSTQAESVTAIHARLTFASDELVSFDFMSFEECQGPEGLIWAPIELEVSVDDGTLDVRQTLWLELRLDEAEASIGEAVLAVEPGTWMSPRFRDPRRASSRYILLARFAHGRMSGFIERSAPAPDYPSEWIPEGPIGRFPAACVGALNQLPIAEAVHGLSPLEAIDVMRAMPPVELDWGSGRVAALTLAIEPRSETACHGPLPGVDGGHATFSTTLTLSTAQGEPVASAELATGALFAPDGCGIPSPEVVHPPCDGPAGQSIAAYTFDLQVKDAARLFAGSLPAGAEISRATATLGAVPSGSGFEYSIEVHVTANEGDEMIELDASARTP